MHWIPSVYIGNQEEALTVLVQFLEQEAGSEIQRDGKERKKEMEDRERKAGKKYNLW